MNHEALPFRDPALPLSERIDDLLGRLRTDEKMRMLHYQSPAVERLGIPEYNWWNEACHGVARAGRATVFPQCIGLGATFDTGLVLEVYRAIAAEARAKYATSALDGRRGQYRGLTFWTPNINIFRDPRWGRGQETFGECPELMSRMGVAAVRGLQGDDPDKLVAAACAKHYAVHSGPEKVRHAFNAIVSMKDLHESYLPAFKALVDAGVEAVMGAYNRTLDEPCCASKLLLQDILRDTWGFEGHVVSDCWAIRDFHEFHGVTETPVESAALALKAGCDLNCGCTYEELPVALAESMIGADDIDRSLRRLLRARFKLGQFDETEESLRRDAALCEVAGPEHRELACRAAAKSIVLAKNDGVLPLPKKAVDLFVTGPMAASVEALLGNYHGVNGRLTSILEGVAGAVDASTTILHKTGCLASRPNANDIDWISIETRNVDACICVVGFDGTMEGEEGDAVATDQCGDRASIMLPEHQRDFVRRCTEASDTPVVLVVTGGSPVALGELAELVDAVLYCGYPGEAGGEAVAQVLFGDENPAGRLPFTVPSSDDDLPPFEDYAMAGRTYRFVTREPLYPFGFGLGYSRFEYAGLAVESEADGASVRVTVTNTSAIDGDEVVQSYLRHEDGGPNAPLAQLAGFRRVSIPAGQSREVVLELPAHAFERVTADGLREPARGRFTLTVGGCSPGERGRELGAPEPQTLELQR